MLPLSLPAFRLQLGEKRIPFRVRNSLIILDRLYEKQFLLSPLSMKEGYEQRRKFLRNFCLNPVISNVFENDISFSSFDSFTINPQYSICGIEIEQTSRSIRFRFKLEQAVLAI